MTHTPYIDRLRGDLRKLVAAGYDWSNVEDIFIGAGPVQVQIYQKALAEWGALPRMVDGVRSGVGSAVGTRSVAGFKEMLRSEAGPQ
jgi:hypothetical protein